jgi:hypothetical protein
LAGIDADKVSRKSRPTFITRIDESISKLDADLFNNKFTENFEVKFEKKLSLKDVKSIKDLAESLRNANTELDDCTFVFCQG